MLEKLTAVQSPELRWPQLKVDAALPEDAQARRGEEVFVTQCLPCHRLNGAGGSEIGPDLGQPMAATDYLTEAGIRALVRDPKSVRTWPQQLPIRYGLSDASFARRKRQFYRRRGDS